MMPNTFYSNDRRLNLADYLEVLVASSFPETAFEPAEISKLRDEGKCSFQIAHEIPGLHQTYPHLPFIERLRRMKPAQLLLMKLTLFLAGMQTRRKLKHSAESETRASSGVALSFAVKETILNQKNSEFSVL